ncbi:MAG: Bug family tripartite tricarboxylate transporter substrate binding protein [Pseudomonadota bacterium]
MNALLRGALAIALATAGAASGQVQVGPIRVLVGFAPGGSADLVARLAAERARDALEAALVVENRPGAGGQIAAEALKNAAPDGRTLMAAPFAITVINPLTHKRLAYDPEKDFAPVSLAASFQLAFSTGPATPAATLAEYIAWVKGDARRGSFGVPAAGSLPHFFGLLLGRAIGVELVHVAYRGGAPLLNDLIGGQIPAGIDVLSEAIPHHRAGRLRILASSGARRSPVAPDVPTFAELGYPQILGEGWFGFYAPAKTPPAVIERLAAALGAAIRSPEVAGRLTQLGLEPVGGGPDALARRTAEDRARWAPIVKASGFTVE